MTFEEWWEREDRVYLNEYSTFKMVAAQAWNEQQKRIDELERFVNYVAKDWIELSHDKVRVQRDDYIKMAKSLMDRSYD